MGTLGRTGLIGWLAVAAVSAAAQQALQLLPESKLWIEGNSTLHAWSAMATELTLTGSVQPSPSPLRYEFLNALVQIPVRALKSGKSGLDENMYQDLKADEYPIITFRLKQLLYGNEPAQDGKLPILIEGWLQVAGRERLLKLPALYQLTGNRLRITGQTKVQMTDFGIKPRTFMVVMKVDNTVVINFDIVCMVK